MKAEPTSSQLLHAAMKANPVFAKSCVQLKHESVCFASK